jgi:hypothetical protein
MRSNAQDTFNVFSVAVDKSVKKVRGQIDAREAMAKFCCINPDSGEMCRTFRQKCPSSGCLHGVQVRCAGHFHESGKAVVVYLSLGDLKWAPTFKWDVRDTSVKVSVLRISSPSRS